MPLRTWLGVRRGVNWDLKASLSLSLARAAPTFRSIITPRLPFSLLGTLAGPLAVGSVAGHYSLNVAAQFVSLLLAVCALGYALFGLETLHAPHARRAAPGASVELRVARAG